MCSHQCVIDVTTTSFLGFLLFPLFFGRRVCLSALSTAIGIFFLSFDAQVRGTGDVVNSLKSEGGLGWKEGGGVS